MIFESLGECTSYLKGKAVIEINLPAKAPTCQYCLFLSCRSPYDRYYCKITNEWILNFKRERGEICPFEWEVKSDEH